MFHCYISNSWTSISKRALRKKYQWELWMIFLKDKFHFAQILNMQYSVLQKNDTADSELLAHLRILLYNNYKIKKLEEP
jgi:spermidine synthase